MKTEVSISFAGMGFLVSMNRFLLCLIPLTLLACGSGKEPVKPAESTPTEAAKPAEPVKVSVPNQRPFAKGKAGAYFRKYAEEQTADQVIIHTRLGDIKLRLYPETPMHRGNFIYLAENGFLNQTLFYRIEKGFMIQGGGTDDKAVVKKRSFLGKYRIPAEMNAQYFHKRGALAMARNYTDNPKKESSEFNFYIVQGQTYNGEQLKSLEREYDIAVPKDKHSIYATLGGAPHLDGEHTVFGEVTEGMDVVDRIAELKTDDGGWPYEDVPMTVEVIHPEP